MNEELFLVNDEWDGGINSEANIKKCFICQCGKEFKTQKELDDHIFEEEYD